MVNPDLAAATLGVSPDASASEIRRAYKRLAQVNHPDHGGDPSVMANINEAYNRLSSAHASRRSDDRGIDFSALDVDDSFQSWEDSEWPEPPPGFSGLWKSLLAVVLLPLTVFVLLVVMVMLVVSSLT